MTPLSLIRLPCQYFDRAQGPEAHTLGSLPAEGETDPTDVH